MLWKIVDIRAWNQEDTLHGHIMETLLVLFGVILTKELLYILVLEQIGLQQIKHLKSCAGCFVHQDKTHNKTN